MENIEIQIQKCKLLLNGDSSRFLSSLGRSESENLFITSAKGADYFAKAAKAGEISQDDDTRVIEGVFDGQKMIGPDGKQYSVPANYISKSKLVEGDILKLIIDEAGNFTYKQIGPVERERRVGTIIKDEEGDYCILAEGNVYKVILASITYFKGEEGDEAVILAPKGVVSQWAAIENIIKK